MNNVFLCDCRNILDLDLALPAEKVHQGADVAVAHVNAAVAELRRLFLVEDLVDSIKFGVLLWSLTYVGSWFNGMTLIIIGEDNDISNFCTIISWRIFVPSFQEWSHFSHCLRFMKRTRHKSIKI